MAKISEVVRVSKDSTAILDALKNERRGQSRSEVADWCVRYAFGRLEALRKDSGRVKAEKAKKAKA